MTPPELDLLVLAGLNFDADDCDEAAFGAGDELSPDHERSLLLDCPRGGSLLGVNELVGADRPLGVLGADAVPPTLTPRTTLISPAAAGAGGGVPPTLTPRTTETAELFDDQLVLGALVAPLELAWPA